MSWIPRVQQATEYLRANGWKLTAHWRGGAVWTWADYDVLVPPTDDLADAPIRLRELLSCVADAEGRSMHAVGRDMTMPSVDLVSYRVRESSSGAMTLPAGARALHAIRALVTTCARDVLGDTRSDIGRADEVAGLLDRTLLYLAEGSFGVDIALPVEGGDAHSPGRLTALRMLHSSTAVLQATVSTADDAVDEIRKLGIVDELCIALADLSGPEHALPFKLGFRWSRMAPIPGSTASVDFPGGIGERVRRLASRPPRPVDPVFGTMLGIVTGLTDDPAKERWRIKVRGMLTTGSTSASLRRVVTVRLDGEQTYAVALDAHRHGRTVRAEGVLVGKQVIKVEPGGFSIVDD